MTTVVRGTIDRRRLAVLAERARRDDANPPAMMFGPLPKHTHQCPDFSGHVPLRGSTAKPIMDVDGRRMFTCAAACATQLNVDTSQVRQCCTANKFGLARKIGGMFLRYVEDDERLKEMVK